MGRVYNVIDADGHILEPLDLWENTSTLLPRPGAANSERRERQGAARDRGAGGRRRPAGIGRVGAVGARQGVVEAERWHTRTAKGGFDPHARIPDMDADGSTRPSSIRARPVLRRDTRSGARRRDVPRLQPLACRLLQALSRSAVRRGHAAAAIRRSDDQGDDVRPQGARHARRLHPAEPVQRQGDSSPRLRAVLGRGGGSRLFDRLSRGASSGMPTVGVDRFEGRGARHIISHTMEMMLACMSVIWGGVCERHPKLRIGFLESGGGWIAPWLDRMDRHFDDRGFNDCGLKTRPSELFQRNCWISFEPVESSIKVLADYIGPHKILWATDYPHPDGFFPGAPKMMLDRLEGVSPETRRQVMAGGRWASTASTERLTGTSRRSDQCDCGFARSRGSALSRTSSSVLPPGPAASAARYGPADLRP